MDSSGYRRCLHTLETAFERAGKVDSEEVMSDVLRAACVKEFELILEMSGSLLRKRLAALFADLRQGKRLSFKDVFGHAAKYPIVEPEVVERWLKYRTLQNASVHGHGTDPAEVIVPVLPIFMVDAKNLAISMKGSQERIRCISTLSIVRCWTHCCVHIWPNVTCGPTEFGSAKTVTTESTSTWRCARRT